MKRIVVLALIALLLSSLAFSSFANDSTALYELVGEKLKHVGIITGDTSGNLKVAGTVTREQAIVILLRMMGKRAEAEAYPKQQVFTDVPSTHWAASYIAYAKNAGLTNGVGNNRFGLGNSVTGIQMASFMLRALGYQATWGVDDIMKMAADQGLMHEVNVQAKDVMIRGKTFVMMRNTLRSKAKGSEEIYAKTIGITEEYFLVDSKPVGPQDPVSPSTPKPTTPALKPVKITKQVPIPVRTSTYNYEELSVYFNIPIATPKPENFKVTVEDGRVLDAKHIYVSGAGNRVILRIPGQGLHGKVVTVEVDGVRSLQTNDPMPLPFEIQATFKDYIPLYVESKKVLNEKSCELYFNVPAYLIKKENLEIKVDGELISDQDYDYTHLGKQLKFIFKPSHLPKKIVEVTYRDLVTAAYRKPIDKPETITFDFTDFSEIKTDHVPEVADVPSVIKPKRPVQEPTPAPTEPTPAPTEPTPAPTEPSPTPTVPAPTEPAPAPCNENPAQIRYMALEDENTLQICFDGNLQSFTTDNIKVQLKTGEELRDLKIVKAQEYPEIVWYLVQSPQAKMTGCIVTLQGLRSAKCGTELPVIEFEPPMTIN